MTDDLSPDDLFVSVSREWRPLWSDLQKIKYLRALVVETEGRIQDLCRNQYENREEIAREEACLAITNKELRKLEKRVSFF